MKRVPELRPDEEDRAALAPGREPAEPGEPHLDAIGGAIDAADIFRRLFATCIPVGSAYRKGRRWRAGYNRMCAIAWIVVPEMFVGMTEEEVAASIGLTRYGFQRHVKAVRAILDARAERSRGR